MPDQVESPPPLIFDWSKPRRPTARLLFWLLMTGLGLGGFFFLFRVVYQAPRHFIPATNHITLLSPNDPASRALLQRISDRDFFVFSNSNESRGSPSLDDRAPVFHPSFENHELKLQDLPQRDTKPPPVRLLDVTLPTLPPPDLRELHAPAAADTAPTAPATFKPTLHLEGTLASRKIASLPDFSSLSSPDITAWRFQLGVDADGRVTFALPVATTEKPADGATMLRLLGELRFASHTEDKVPSPMWGIASFTWSQSVAP